MTARSLEAVVSHHAIPSSVATSLPHPVGVRHITWKDGGAVIEAVFWYPARADGRPPARYLGVLPAHAVENAEPLPGRSPLAMMSHGYGGNRFDQAFLAEHLAARGIACLAVGHPDSHGRPNRWRHLHERPSRFVGAFRCLSAESGLGGIGVDWDRVILVGHSAGAYSALVGAGGNPRFDLEPEFFPVRDRLAAFVPADHRIGGVRAVILLAPALSNLFDAEGLWPVTCPVLIVAAEHETARLLGSVAAYAARLPDARFVTLPGAGHHAFINQCPPALQRLAPDACGGDSRPRGELHQDLQAIMEPFLRDVLGEGFQRRERHG